MNQTILNQMADTEFTYIIFCNYYGDVCMHCVKCDPMKLAEAALKDQVIYSTLEALRDEEYPSRSVEDIAQFAFNANSFTKYRLAFYTLSKFRAESIELKSLLDT